LNDIYLLISFIFCASIILFLTNRIIGVFDFRNLSVIGFFFITFSLNLIGGIIIFFNKAYIQTEIRYTFICMIFFGLVGVCIGATIISVLMRYRHFETIRYLRSNFYLNIPVSSISISVIIIILISMTMLFMFSKSVQLPILYVLSDVSSPGELKIVRAMSYKTLPDYITHPMNLMRMTFLPFITVLSFLIYCKFLKKKLFIFFLFVLFVTITFNSYTTALYPVAMVFAILIISIWITRQIKLKWILIFSVSFVIVIIGTSFLFSGNKDPIEIAKVEINRHINRFVLGVPDIMLSYVEYYFEPSKKLWGAAHRPIALLINTEPANVANTIFLYRNPTGYHLGNASAPFVAYLYADFGLVGVLIGALFFGAILQFLQIYCVRRRHDLINLSLYIMVIWIGFAAPSTSITTALISKGILPILFIPHFIRILSRFFYRATKVNKKRQV